MLDSFDRLISVMQTEVSSAIQTPRVSMGNAWPPEFFEDVSDALSMSSNTEYLVGTIKLSPEYLFPVKTL